MGSNYVKKKSIGALVMIFLGVIFMVSIIDSYIELGCFEAEKIPALILSVLIILYGVLLMFVRINKYGWGIGTILFATSIADGEIRADLKKLIACACLAIAFAIILLLANVKKDKRQ